MIHAFDRKFCSILQAIGVASLLVAFPAGAGLLKTEREADGLQGPVHTVTEDWGETRFMINYYDRVGNLIKLDMNYGGGTQSHLEVFRTVFERDADGRKNRSKTVGADGKALDEIHYTYNQSGNLAEQRTYREGKLLFKFVYGYDDRGNNVETKTYLSDGSLRSKSTYTYDSKGNIVTISSYKECTSEHVCKLEYKAENTHDDKSNRTQAVIYKADGSVDERSVYTYNAKRQEQEKVVYNADGSFREKETYTYEYDSTGNWIKKISQKAVHKDGAFALESSHIIQRTIAYYNKASCCADY